MVAIRERGRSMKEQKTIIFKRRSRYKISPRKAIQKKCLDCSVTSKDVTLCYIFDCPLWEFRTGYHISTKAYKVRMNGALERYQDELNELKREGIDIQPFYESVK